MLENGFANINIVAPLLLLALGIALLRYNRPSGGYRRMKPRLGDEAINFKTINDANKSYTAANQDMSHSQMNDWMDRQVPQADPESSNYSEYNEKENAEKLVKGIIGYNQLVLFVRNLNEFDTTSPDAKTRALLQEGGVAFKTVDVSKDPTMHLAFPEDGTEMSLPMVYANNKKIGSYDVIKKMHRDGTLDALFSK
jgi:glutaredoxin